MNIKKIIYNERRVIVTALVTVAATKLLLTIGVLPTSVSFNFEQDKAEVTAITETPPAVYSYSVRDSREWCAEPGEENELIYLTPYDPINWGDEEPNELNDDDAITKKEYCETFVLNCIPETSSSAVCNQIVL